MMLNALLDLVVEAGALAVAVDKVGAYGADAQDGEADDERDARVHAHVNAITHVNTFLAVCHPDGSNQAQHSE